jgi:tetratricopeptide (TPR) repeat protein
MQNINIKKAFLFGLSFIVFWALFMIKIAPTFIAGDSPETIMAFNFLGIQHPAGYALNTMIGKIFLLIPIGNLMLKSAIMAMLFNIATAVVIFEICLIIFRKEENIYIVYGVSAIAAVLYLFSNTVVLQGFTAKGSVYTLHGLLIAVIFLSLFKIKENIRYIYLAAFVFGLSLGNHWESSVVLCPAIAIIVLGQRKKINIRNWLKCSILFLIGLSVLSYIFIRSSAHPIMAWGDVKDLKSLMWLLGRTQYTFSENAHNLSDTLRHLTYYIKNVLPEDYPMLIAFLLIPGAILLIWKLPEFGYALSVAYICAIFSIFIVATNHPNSEFIVRQFLTFTYIFVSIFISFFIYWIINLLKTERLKTIMIYIVLLVATVFLYSEIPDYSRYYISYDYLKNLTKSVPEGALYFAEGDFNCMGALYESLIEKNKVNVIMEFLLDQDWYREQLKRDYQNQIVITDKVENRKDDIRNLMNANAGKDIYYSNQFTGGLLSYDLAPRGIVNEVLMNKTRPKYDPYLYYRHYSFRGIFDSDAKHDDFTTSNVLDYYAFGLLILGIQTNSDIDLRIFYDKRSFLFDENANTLAAIGGLYFQKTDYESGLNYLNQALMVDAKCLSVYFYRVRYYLAMKDLTKVRENLNEILKIDNNNADAKSLLKQLNGV